MAYNGDIFHNCKKKNNQITYCLKVNSRKAALADKQSSFPDLNAALRHIHILYRELGFSIMDLYGGEKT